MKKIKLIRGQYNYKNQIDGCVLTIGNFDGVHLGHQALIKQTKLLSDELKVPSVVMTFEPQPKEFFMPQPGVARLMRLREKIRAIEHLGIDWLYCARFNKNFAAISAEDFITEILLKQLKVKAIVLGSDFRFGAKRAGDLALLKQYAKQYQFKVIEMPMVKVGDERVSSTRVREALQAGDIQTASQFLGHDYRLIGKVAYGDQLGRKIGFPTANLHLHRKLVPMTGIFVVRVHGIGDQPINGVANLGTRPTVDGTRILLEVYCFDFNRDIYRYNIEVEFLHKLRDEEKYATLDELVEHIKKDVVAAENYFATVATQKC
jgi:riboflavin kinase / FMN adenylyltransferase